MDKQLLHSLPEKYAMSEKNKNNLKKFFILTVSIFTFFFASQTASAGPVHAFYADEHNTSANGGNRILEIDIDNMTLVNSVDLPGVAGHHADNGYNSKLYGSPKGSGFVNVIELRKDQAGNTSMRVSKQIDLIHMPRSGDAFNKKYNIILMAAKNRPMGSFINVETDEVVGTIGENVDCTLTDGTRLLSHADANTIAAATKYQCIHTDHGGDQISGHPYWLTPDHAAIVDRTNNQISVYTIWQEGNQIKSRLLNNLPTRTSVHQIVPRDRTNLPPNEQADFYAVEEGRHVNSATDYNGGIPHALLKMKLTSTGLQLISRMDLQRVQVLPKTKADRILNACISIYRSTFNEALNGPSQNREDRYNQLFAREGIARSPFQDPYNDFPIDCFYPGIPGGHNADFAPNNKHLYVPMAGGAVSIIDVDRWKIVNNIDIGVRSGVGHFCFSEKNDVALSSNHGDTFSNAFGASMTRSIRYINSDRPIGYYWIKLPFTQEGLTNSYQSHSCYIDRNEDYYYNFFTDGGIFYKIDLKGVFNNPTNGSDALVVDWLYTGGIPIQGSFIDIDDIQTTSGTVFAANNDTAESDGSLVFIDVLQNDSGSNLVLEEVDPASNGYAKIVNGMISYTPNTGFSGTDNFWYGISSNGNWEWALVTVSVNSSTPPTPLKANRDEVSVASNTEISIDVLANDTGTNLRLGWYDAALNGSLRKDNGKFIYKSNPGFSGTEDLWYEIIDASGQTTWGNLLITVTAGNSGSVVANNDSATVQRGDTVVIDVLANDTGTGIKLAQIDNAWTGSISIANGKVEYVASGNATGILNVWYSITDANGDNESWAMISINIIP